VGSFPVPPARTPANMVSAKRTPTFSATQSISQTSALSRPRLSSGWPDQ
jgi:hypothetical protein